MRPLLNVAYSMLIDRASDRDALDDAIFTSPLEQRRRRSEEIRRIVLESGGEVADVIPIRGTA